MFDKVCARSNKNIKNLFSWVKYKFDFPKLHKDYFYPTGIMLFVGEQGSGKTMSAVKYVVELMKEYPSCLLVTNVSIKGYEVDNKRVFPFVNNDDFTTYHNGEQGVIFFVDEIQLYLNSLNSKNIDVGVMARVSQLRKQRSTVVCTSQRLNRVAKPLREQYPTVIDCKNYLGFFQVNRVVANADVDDAGHTVGNVFYKYNYFHAPVDYDLYDSYGVISSNKGNFKGGVYNDL